MHRYVSALTLGLAVACGQDSGETHNGSETSAPNPGVTVPTTGGTNSGPTVKPPVLNTPTSGGSAEETPVTSPTPTTTASAASTSTGAASSEEPSEVSSSVTNEMTTEPDPTNSMEPAPTDSPGPSDETGETSEPEPVTFARPTGKIPNDPIPANKVNLDRAAWQQGIISPSMLKGHQINQPTVFNGYLLIGGNEEFWFFDVSDPTAPKQVSAFTTPQRRVGGEAESHTLSMARYGDKFYLVTIGGTGIDTWDVTDVTKPTHVGKVKINGANYGDYTEAVWGVTWQGQYIYVGATNNGIKVVDAADPANLKVVAEVPTPGGVSAGPLEAVGNVLVVTTPKESGGVATVDITDPVQPVRLASFTTGKSYIGQFYRHWVFLIGPIRAWDVLTDPRNIGASSSPIGQMNNDNAEYMTFSDDYMFLGHVRAEIGGNPGSSKINVSNPSRMSDESRVWGRMDLGNKNDDQFNLPIGNLLVIGDDPSPYPGWFLAAHAADPDTKAPEVDTVIPKDAATQVSTKSRIGVSFSDNIEIATVNAASFIVRPQGGQPLSGKYGVRMGVVNFDPDEDLEPGTTYEVVLPAGGVTDFVGNALTKEWKSTFTTN